MVELLAWTFSIGCFLLTLHLIRTRGFLEGSRPIWLIVLLLIPIWFGTRYASIRIDPRLACALAILIGFLRQPIVHRDAQRWYFSDLAVFLLLAGITLTTVITESFDLLTAPDKVREIALPYIIGRLFLRSARDIETILPGFCLVITILAGYTLIEAVSQKNLIEELLGKAWAKGDVELGEDIRWGLKRARGPQTHPIYMGLTFAMLMPWAVEAAVQSWQGKGPRWWRLMPVFVLVGIISTGSRGAQMCVLVVLGAIFFQAFPRLRVACLFGGVLAGAVFLTAREEIVLLLAQYAEETRGGTEYVQINGIWKDYTGTKHRDLLNEVYEEAIDSAGWLGYGTQRLKMPKDPDMDKRFESIDNHYLMWFLQYGYLGLILFFVLALSVLLNLLPFLLNGIGPSGRLGAGLFGAMVGTLIAMRTVWFAPDYEAVWLFCAGLSVSVARLRDSSTEGASPGG